MPNKLVKRNFIFFDILAYPTKFPTIFSQSNGFRLTGMNVDKPQMIKKNLMLTEQENVDEQKNRGVRIFVSHIFNKINELKLIY